MNAIDTAHNQEHDPAAQRSTPARPSTAHRSLRLAVTGASGFIGAALEPALIAAGHTVLRVSRSEPRPGTTDLHWDPAGDEVDARGLEGLDGVIHLAGENIAQRWTDDARRQILESRTRGTGLLARTLAALDRPPGVLVSMSAVGIYGPQGDVDVDESSPPGTGFLAEVVQAWEAAAEPARAAGIRVVHPRIGVVLGQGGGVLERLLTPFRMGLGGPVGDGKQWMSWVARSDVTAALRFLIAGDAIDGPVNVVSPGAVRNETFTTALGHVLHRPTLGTVPAFALRAVYGQMAEETLLSGQRVRPTRLLEAGFTFGHPMLEEALRWELGRA
ncbi:MAG: TIGR01777 family oxidoreductase [Gemmatimonadaceae bacterium]